MAIPILQSRNAIPGLLEILGLNGVGVEVGAGSGYYSSVLLRDSRLRRLFSVDPWGKGLSEDPLFQNMLECDWYLECVKELSQFGLRSVVLRMLSVEAASLFLNESLDFCYIDANHDQFQVLEDLQVWWPKVRSGGILAGHDYTGIHWGVKIAVDTFFAEQTIHTTVEDEVFEGSVVRSWLVEKF